MAIRQQLGFDILPGVLASRCADSLDDNSGVNGTVHSVAVAPRHERDNVDSGSNTALLSERTLLPFPHVPSL